MIKKKIYIWCCDFNTNSGEGIIANKFVKDLKKYNKRYLINIKISKSNKKNIFFERFVYPYIGIIYLWKIYFTKKNKNVCYVNYLPLWNFLIFLLLPPSTVLGPITGGSFFSEKQKVNFFLRKYIFSICYLISIIILNIRKNKLLFATNLLENKFKKKNSLFNYVFKDFIINNNKIKKKYDLIFYLRDHRNKNTNLQINLANKLSHKFKIVTVGKKINHNKNIINLGNVSRKKLFKVLDQTKYAFISSENLYSFFLLDSIKYRTNIFFLNLSNYKSSIIKGICYLKDDTITTLSNKISKELKKKYFFKIKYKPAKIAFSNYFKL